MYFQCEQNHLRIPEGIAVDKLKTESIQNIKPPTSAGEVRSFLGLVNYCHKFIPNYSTVAEPLRRLTKKNCLFAWDKEQRESFIQLKEALINPPVMCFYNPSAETKVIVDASSTGLGAILTQEQPNGEFKPASYDGSRSLSEVETRCSQTEREALAVVWACEHYHYCVYDRHITIITDHKPLEVLLSTSSRPPPRIQRWMLRLQAYDYNIRYAPGSKNAADILFRSPIPENDNEENPANEYIRMIVKDAIPKTVSLKDIQDETKNDTILSEVMKNIKSNTLNKFKHHVYFQVRNELSVENNIILKGQSIVIPKLLQHHILSIALSQHQGIVKTKALLREKFGGQE